MDEASVEKTHCLLIYPRFSKNSFWSFSSFLKILGYKHTTPPLGLMTVAALLPKEWDIRLADLNTRDLDVGELEWADPGGSGGCL